MKRKNKTLALIIAAAITCLSLAACSSGENEGAGGEGSPESDMPPISVDLSESAQTTPDNAAESISDASSDTEETSAPETAETESTSPEETEPVENPETSIINTEETSETSAETSPETTRAVAGEANGIAATASAMVGKPFFFGGADPETGFDNSGLMHYVLKVNGVDCPRLTGDIAAWGEKATYEELQPGYLVFFEYEGSGKADFGGIYIGGGKMVVSTDEDKPVSEVDITTDYYQRTFQFGIKTF